MSGLPGKKKCLPVQAAKVPISTDQEKTKRCSLCKETKPYDLFNKRSCEKDGYNYYCRDCSRAKLRKFQKENPEKSKKWSNDWKRNNRDKENAYRRNFYSKYPEVIKAQNKRHTDKHIDKIKVRQKNYRLNHIEEAKEYLAKWYIDHNEEVKLKTKQWAIDNPEKVKIYDKRKRKKKMSKPMGRLNRNMSFRIWTCLKTLKASRSWKEFVSFTIVELRDHLEKQFTKGMSWDNYGEWHVDHKIPLAAFIFQLPTDDEFKKAWALSNLQPMWGIENVQKGKKILHPELYKELTGRYNISAVPKWWVVAID